MRLRGIALVIVCGMVAGCSRSAPEPAAHPAFEAHWRDGRAELDAYRITMHRYGAERQGRATLIYVTEPFGARDRVKVDDPSRHAGDVLDVLKMNLARDFQTGIYDYNTMLSTFVRVADLAPVKVSFASTEWCGNVYEEMRVDPARIEQLVRSYFEGESGDRALPRPADGLLEDELFVRVRGLRGEWLKPGEKRKVPFLEGALFRRLRHRPAEWTTATIERAPDADTVAVPAGEFAAIRYRVQTESGRRCEIEIEAEAPHRIVRWTWSAPPGARSHDASETAELTGSMRLPYWQLNGPGDERYLDSLGIGAPALARP